MRKPAFCICQNKGTDQLCGNNAADQHICFCYKDCKILQKFRDSSYLLWLYSLVRVEPGINTKDSFSRNMAHVMSPATHVLHDECTVESDNQGNF